MTRPNLIFHVDWSSQPIKRWLAWGRRVSSGGYEIYSPLPVQTGERLWTLVQTHLPPDGCALVGFDFPIGLPLEYAQKIGCSHFLSFLNQLENSAWPDWFRVADQAAEINLRRPFYPSRPGGKRLAHLVERLELSSPRSLWRECDRATPYRRAAAPLFWTMGAQQVGKTALSGWRELLIPARHLTQPQVRLWPFEGRLDELLQPSTLVIAETYPAEYYAALGLDLHLSLPGQKKGKRSYYTRCANAPNLLAAVRKLGIHLAPDLEHEINQGFGPALTAEDAFDALVGLLGMIMVLENRLPTNPPSNVPYLIEGWILGLRRTKTDYNEIG
ncbi:hypothetical protein QYE77_12985 [Thermanaerothrix sp. 4228-RoL]|uniref:DUF429 domain-containing protein n=1 Tax=Thermanaerothrix solaris TaxID=3058434 RepID=A0ABU3NST8_9CHLR|nr:hypothetical protein [Thermanaerothrix sp. 4228-RoL]MDT8899177.1 hypothetical protein [Thermanaerothrix sp. 4228-RoL]